VLGLLAAASFMFGLVTSIASAIPSLDPARQARLQSDGFIYAADGRTVLARLQGSQSRVIVPSTEIAPIMKQAIVSIEDKRFFVHRGVDLRGIARAVWADVRHKRVVQGGSTITQQFVKNTYTRNERSIGRKLKEAALAWQLEQRWSKDRILTAYLNTIYFGNGAYGIQRASTTYFGHSAAKLTLAEAALLAGIPEDPSRYDPVTNPTEARARRELVLREMLAQGDIGPGRFAEASRAPLPKADEVRQPGVQGPAPYFTNYVKQQLVDHYGPGRVFGGGLHVTTTIDLHLQDLARQAISKVLTDENGPSAALVAVDARTGRVLAMYGGKNYRQSQFNLAVQGERQAGSSFKPFVLAAALKAGISPTTTLVSRPVVIPAGGRLWEVHNYENSYLGPINLATATTESDNSVFAQLTRLVGPANVVRAARSLGITSPLRAYFSIGLGAQGVNPLEMARAFASLANGGSRIDGTLFGNRPRAVEQVVSGKSVDRNRPRPRRVLSPEDDAIETSMLEGVVREGTGRAAALPDRPAAGKTGTTENYGDAWFVGYTPQVVTAVWVGYPTRLRPMLTEYHGGPVAGGTFPAEIWKAFMESADAYLHATPEQFSSPVYPYAAAKRVVWRNGVLRLDNGICRFAEEIVYFAGHGPSTTADCKPNEVEVPRVIGQKLRAAEQRLAGQPLTPELVYKPAKPKQRVDIVIDQFPKSGYASSFDKVTLVLAKPLHGVVPRVVGLPLREATAKLRRLGIRPVIAAHTDGRPGHVVWQAPMGRIAAAPGLEVKLGVGRG
jgi:penicillin-binding protein 1A